MMTAYEKEHLSERQPLPDRYLSLSDEEMDRRIAAAKAALGAGSLRIWLLSGWNASGMNAWNPPVSSCRARARSM